MSQTKPHELSDRAERRPTSETGNGMASSGSLAFAALADGRAAPPKRLATLRTVISNHKALLAKVRRRNDALRDDNARMERELAVRTPEENEDDNSGRSLNGALPVTDTQQKLRWVNDYLHGTLAQTLWALDVHAARLEEQVPADDRQEARRVLELTHAAYDQLRSLLARLHDKTDD